MVGSIFKTALATLVALQARAVEGAQRSSSPKSHWVDIWGSMPQLVEYTNMPPPPFNESGIVFQNASLRQTIFITQSAPTIRLVISNAFGGSDLPISSATLAVPLNGSAGTSAIKPESLAQVTWSGGLTNITIPDGARAISDPIQYPATAQEILTISMYLATGQTTNLITGHPGSRTNSYYSPGNVTALADVATLNATQTSQHWYFISAVEGYLPTSLGTRAISIIGDSITDGRESDNNENDRWPDNVLRRLQAPNATAVQKNIAVINQAAGGNRVLYDGNGPNALGRVDRDVLAQSGVTYAMVFEGVNDIGTAGTDAASQANVGDRLISAFDQMISMVHAKNIPMFGATITPFGGEGQAYSDPNREATRQRVNKWIRESGRYDAVVDFDAVIRDPANVSIINPEYDSGDHLHPNELGYTLMAEAFDLSLFDKYQNGVEERI
ncbi:SGNH hydrolase [Cryphonectria parasitica EP155]|uniref:SGNH hydrolase n=1 Tax=Cryphonectria parasitica (strain ATCC 38755 / EP155) TaxID=660469 RepID=A0A9P4Y1L3_CRYP1|nr:SGNH hydrolase [Cryphonectria parasitica EP155]KAF3764843.1 SGNH hydrolase [Cryphonectria parasitica EP155]